jgi:hypothetical protein
VKEESSSFLKKITKKHLISVQTHRPQRVGSVAKAEGTKVFCFFFSKKKCLPLLVCFHLIALA